MAHPTHNMKGFRFPTINVNCGLRIRKEHAYHLHEERRDSESFHNTKEEREMYRIVGLLEVKIKQHHVLIGFLRSCNDFMLNEDIV